MFLVWQIFFWLILPYCLKVFWQNYKAIFTGVHGQRALPPSHSTVKGVLPYWFFNKQEEFFQYTFFLSTIKLRRMLEFLNFAMFSYQFIFKKWVGVSFPRFLVCEDDMLPVWATVWFGMVGRRSLHTVGGHCPPPAQVRSARCTAAHGVRLNSWKQVRILEVRSRLKHSDSEVNNISKHSWPHNDQEESSVLIKYMLLVNWLNMRVAIIGQGLITSAKEYSFQIRIIIVSNPDHHVVKKCTRISKQYIESGSGGYVCKDQNPTKIIEQFDLFLTLLNYPKSSQRTVKKVCSIPWLN